jgi:hypothetical protein
MIKGMAMLNRNVRRLGLFVLMGLGALAATGFTSSRATITVSGEVPLICRVSFAGGSGTFDTGGTARLGTTSEFCNSADGYRLYARASENADDGDLVVGGRVVALVPGSEVLIHDQVGPAVLSRTVDYTVADGNGGGNVTLRIEAK